MNVFELEQHLISPDDWISHLESLPATQREMLKKHMEDPYADGPMGLGYTPSTGYFILGSGQGPFIIWIQNS